MNTSEKRQVSNGPAHAVVLGGSFAGLLAARVLSDHFEHVTLIERDVYTETLRNAPRHSASESRAWAVTAWTTGSRRSLSRSAGRDDR